MPRRLSALVSLLAFLSGLVGTTQARAQQGPGLARIRDAEIESYVRQWATPVWQAAELDPSQVTIVIVNSPQINAFVAGGLNIFLYTELLIRSESANQVVGVMAHETGHIAGGHLARLGEAIEQAQITEILGLVLGAAAVVASGGRGDAGLAGVGAGANLAEKNFLSFSRTQERSADQAGVNFLERSGQSARGLYDFMKMLQGEEFLQASRQDPYLRTHPLTQDRIDFIQHFLETSKYANAPPRPGYVEEHARMRGKLIGFIWPIPRVFQRYKDIDNSVESRYARSIAYHRESNDQQALRLIDSLLAEKPDDPFFNELKGQFLFEGGKVREAVAPYQKADRLLPHNALIETEMAQAMIESGDPRFEKEAAQALNDATTTDKDDPITWRYLAVVYGRQGDEPHATLALAEQAFAEGRYPDAKGQAKRAQKMFSTGSPGYIRAQDIEQQADKAIKDAKRS